MKDPESSSGPPAPLWRRGHRLVVLLGVAIPLLVLATATLVVQQRTSALRSELFQVAEPARALSQDVQYHLARQMALLRGFALTRDETFLAEYRASRELENELWPELRSRTAQLGEDAVAAEMRLERATEQWRALIDPDALFLVPVDPAAVAEVELEDLRYEAVLRMALELEDAITGVQTEMLASILRLEGTMAVLTYLVVLVALAGSLTAVWYLGKSQAYAAEAEARRQEAARQAAARNRLLRGLSHDVKNPLSAAAAYTEMLQMRAAPRLEQREQLWVERIGETLRAAFGLLDDLVTLSRVEAGELRMELEDVDVNKLLARVVRLEEATFEEAGVGLELELPERLPLVRSNGRRLEQILTNLLSNARKYTPAGGRTVLSASVDSRGTPRPAQHWMAVRVSDDGPGIPADHQESVFDEFTRLDPARAKGFGLGLAMSRSIAEALGGRLTLESAPGVGSTFTLWIPLDGPGARESGSPQSGAGLFGLRDAGTIDENG